MSNTKEVTFVCDKCPAGKCTLVSVEWVEFDNPSTVHRCPYDAGCDDICDWVIQDG